MQVVSNTGSTTLTAAITTTGQTAISVAAGQNLAAGGVIQVDSELMQISSITGLNLVVTRAFAGTSAATHSNAATVTIMAAIEIGPILSSTTALPATSLAITYAQIRVDLTALSGSGTCVTTDAWGTAVLYLSLAAGAHVVDVQTSTTIPWREPCFYVGPVGATALAAAGLALQISGNVTGTSTANLVSTNIAWATSQQQACVGQIITFTSGGQAGKSYSISGASQAGSYLKLGVFPNWPSPYPAAGDGFVLSNVATANALTNAIATLPTLPQILGGDQTPITMNSGTAAASVATGQGADAATILTYLEDILVQIGTWPTPQTFTTFPGTYHIPYSQGYGISVYAGATLLASFGNNLLAGDTLTIAYNTTSHVLTVTSANGVSFPTYTETGVTSVTITGEESGPIYGVGAGDANGNVCATQAVVGAAIAANPLAVIAALITAGVLQYVSGSSGPLQFTTTAIAELPPPVNVSTEDTIEYDGNHNHRY